MVTGLLQALTLAGIEIPAHFLVVGSRGLGAVRRLLLGTVSEKVLQHALCPVLIVKESGTPAG
jgi:nucleotide-binding universal stress UspA family protein